MKKYKVRYGMNVHVLELPSEQTIGDIKRNPNFRAVLGYGDNVQAIYNGVTLSNDAEAPEYIESPLALSNPYEGAIVMETAVNTKQSE